MTKISVIVPCYNVGKYIKRCLDSLTKQTLTDIEIICVDDKSTDNTVDVIKSYSDKRIKLIQHKTNMGVGSARNDGFKIATGEYVSFIDPDDYVDLDFYEKLFDVARKYAPDIVKGTLMIENLANNTKTISELNNMISQNIMFFCGEHTCAIYKRCFLMDNNIFYPEDVMTGQDVVFLSSIVLHTNKIQIVNSAYYHYVQNRPNSLDSATLSHNKVLSRLKMLNYKLEMLKSADFANDADKDIFIRYQILNHFIELYSKPKDVDTDSRLVFDWIADNKEIFTKKLLRKIFNKTQLRAIYKNDFDLFMKPQQKTQIFYKERLANGRRRIYFCGIKILSYTKKQRIDSLKTCKYVHIMHNDKFVAPFVDFMNRNFNPNEHLFLCIYTCPQFPFPMGTNVVKIESLRHLKLSDKNIKQVIFHSLFTPGCVEWLYKNKNILRNKALWEMWGGDLYNAPRDKKNDFVRKNFWGYINTVDREYALAKYGMRDNFFAGGYIFPTIEYVKNAKTHKHDTINVLINNSADDSTLDALDMLQHFKNENIKVWTNLSYGKMGYCAEIIAKGRKLFGDKFAYNDQYMSPDKYVQFIADIDILILNQNRQQGVGNTLTALLLGKKVFIRGEISTFGYFNNEKKLHIADTRDIMNMTFDDFVANKYATQNKKIAENITSENYIVNEWRILFDE